MARPIDPHAAGRLLLQDTERSHCDTCLPQAQAEQRLDFATAGPAALARLRADGRDPAHGGDAAKRRSDRMRRRQREAVEWEAQRATEPVDAKQYSREILPAVQDIPLRRLAEATGLSLRYYALIRRDERVPNPRHWEALRAAAQAGRSYRMDRAARAGAAQHRLPRRPPTHDPPMREQCEHRVAKAPLSGLSTQAAHAAA